MYEQEFKQIFSYADSKTDEIEILLSAAKSFTVKINQQEVESFNYSDAKGIGVRVIKNGKVGYAYTEKFDEESFKIMIDDAVENSATIESDEVVVLDNYPDISNKPNVYNEALNDVDVKDKIELAKKLEALAKNGDDRVINVPMSVYSDSNVYYRIANSKGLDKEDKANYAFSYVGVLVEENKEKRMAYDFKITRDFSEFNAEDIAAKAVKKSIDLLNAKEFETGTYPVVFNQETMATMLATFSSVFSAKSVQEGKSLLKDKIGQSVVDEKINIVDDALHPDGMGTQAFDSEGYPAQKTSLIEKGVLKSYLHNSITALKDGVKSTGNGTRGYKGSLGVGTTNFYLEPGTSKVEELFAGKEKIVEIVSLAGMHSGANPISGDFSLSAEGFLWEKGVRQYSLKQFTISGNFLDMLNSVDLIADNFEFDTSSIGASSVLIKEMAISS